MQAEFTTTPVPSRLRTYSLETLSVLLWLYVSPILTLPSVAGAGDGVPVREEVTAVTGAAARGGHGESGELGASGGLAGDARLRHESG